MSIIMTLTCVMYIVNNNYRTTNYQKKITQIGSKSFEIICAIKIQKNWRGHWCRVLYYDDLRSVYSNVCLQLYLDLLLHSN